MRRTKTQGEKNKSETENGKGRKKQNGDRRMKERAAGRKADENPPRESKRKQTLRQPRRLWAGRPQDPRPAASNRKAAQGPATRSPGRVEVGSGKWRNPTRSFIVVGYHE